VRNASAEALYKRGKGNRANDRAVQTHSRQAVREALLGKTEFGIDPAVLKRIASEVLEIQQMGVQVACVIGGGNIFRGTGWPAPASTAPPAITWACWPRS
jgi:hypothetical protein